MLIKVSILVVAIIGIAAAGQTFQTLFSSGTFPKAYGPHPIVYLVPVTSAAAGSVPAVPASTSAPSAVTPNQQLTTNLITAAQNAAMSAGYSLRSNRRSTKCPTSPQGVRAWRGMRSASDQCVFCFCSEMISATASDAELSNCRSTACGSAVPTAAATWTSISSATPWVSLGAATDYQLYKVPTGYCFVEPYDSTSMGRNMHCYESNP